MDILKSLKKVNQSLQESSFSRLLSHTKGDFCVITAFRGEYDLATNQERNEELVDILHDHQLGFYKIRGCWRESPKDMDWEKANPDELVERYEDSFFVPRNVNSISDKDFCDLMFELCNKFEQNAIVLVCKSQGYNGTYGKNRKKYTDFRDDPITVNKIAADYSRWVKRLNTPFVFESVYIPDAPACALAGMRKFGYLW